MWANPKQVIDRVAVLAHGVITEAETAEAAVGAMPAGGHELLGLVRQAIERRACALLDRLKASDDQQRSEVQYSAG
jgi:hypothetical protein